MQIVIDIPEEVKHKVYAYGLSLCPSDKEQLIHAIMNGTPLPKGHGRLGDLDALDNGLREQQRSYEHTFGIRQPINEAVRDGIIISRCHIDHAPTIIEADTESEVVCDT